MRALMASEAIDGVAKSVGTVGLEGAAGKRPRVAAAAVGVSRTGKLGRCVATCALQASAALRRDTASRQAPSSA